MAQVAARALIGDQAREVRRRADPTLEHDHLAHADLAHDVEMVALVRMQAEEHQAAFAP
jgi:hypothetical protein